MIRGILLRISFLDIGAWSIAFVVGCATGATASSWVFHVFIWLSLILFVSLPYLVLYYSGLKGVECTYAEFGRGCVMSIATCLRLLVRCVCFFLFIHQYDKVAVIHKTPVRIPTFEEMHQQALSQWDQDFAQRYGKTTAIGQIAGIARSPMTKYRVNLLEEQLKAR